MFLTIDCKWKQGPWIISVEADVSEDSGKWKKGLFVRSVYKNYVKGNKAFVPLRKEQGKLAKKQQYNEDDFWAIQLPNYWQRLRIFTACLLWHHPLKSNNSVL